MKRIAVLFLSVISVTPLFSQGNWVTMTGRDWSTATYDQYYIIFHYNDYRDLFYDQDFPAFKEQWESGDYELLRTCEYYTYGCPIVGSDVLVLTPQEDLNGDPGVCMANTLVGMKTPVPDNFAIPSMPDINLFFVDLDFIIKQKNHLNSLTIPNMIRGVYSTTGEKLYVDTLYVEGDYECMLNNAAKDNSVLNVFNKDVPPGSRYNIMGYRDENSSCSDIYALEGKEPVLIAKTVIYEGEPIKSYTKMGKGTGFDCDNKHVNYLMANQWGDRLESVELTDKSLRGVASNAFNGCKSLTRVKMTFPEWGGDFETVEKWVDGKGYINVPVIRIGSKSFYGCDNLEVCDLGDDSITVYEKAGKGEPNRFVFGDSVFANCINLDTFRCKNQHMVKNIGKYMFLGCRNLRYFGNWDDVVSVGMGAFDGCEGITGHISIPNSGVGSFAFRNCVNLESIEIAGGFHSAECFKGCTSLEEVRGKDDLSNGIGEGVFEDCVNLKSIDLSAQGYDNPLKVELRIGARAFMNCRSLECDVVTCTGPYKLERWSSSEQPKDRQKIFDSAFAGSGIKSVELSYVNAANAFDNCANLESATFWGPDEGRNTFELPDFRNCPKLKKIVVNGGGWDLEAQVTLKDEQTVKVIDNLDGLYLLGKPHIYVGDYPNYNFANTILYVPKGMKNVYRENALAPTFKDIVELTDEQVGIIKVGVDGAAGEGNDGAPVYDLSGRRVLETVPGNIYISKGHKFIAR